MGGLPQRVRRRDRSRLKRPAPWAATKRKTKQSATASSPLFWIGQKPCGAWLLKYAAAISPEAMKAATRVKRPSAMSAPPPSSMMPAASIKGEPVITCPPKAPKSFCAPWHAKSVPAKNLRRANAASESIGSGGRGAGLNQPLLHLFAPDQAGLLEEEQPAFHHREVRDSLHSELGSELRVRLRVHLQDHGPARHLGRRALDLRSRHFAGPAPFRPEVHEHRDS